MVNREQVAGYGRRAVNRWVIRAHAAPPDRLVEDGLVVPGP